MTKHPRLIVPAVILGVLLLVVAGVYFVQTAADLPSFFPGHAAATDAEAAHHHTKHGIAAALLGIGCLIFAWFQTGPSAPTGDEPA